MGQQAGCPGNLGAGMLSRAAEELMSQRSPQDHGGRAAWKPTHSDVHHWSRAVGEGRHSLLLQLSCGSAAWGTGKTGRTPRSPGWYCGTRAGTDAVKSGRGMRGDVSVRAPVSAAGGVRWWSPCHGYKGMLEEGRLLRAGEEQVGKRLKPGKGRARTAGTPVVSCPHSGLQGEPSREATGTAAHSGKHSRDRRERAAVR